jgi:hypothetical protein
VVVAAAAEATHGAEGYSAFHIRQEQGKADKHDKAELLRSKAV